MKKSLWILFAAAICATALMLHRYALQPFAVSVAPGDAKEGLPASFPGLGSAAAYKAKVAIATAKIDEQNPLRYYKPRPGLEGRGALDEIFVKGVPATAQSVSLARALMQGGTLSADERIPMVRILASLHNRENTTGANDDIALDLKALAADPDKQVAAQAATSYARLDYLPGTELVLKKALENGALDTNAYFQELAHLVPSAPMNKKEEFLAEIRASGSLIGRDVLVMALNSGEEFNAVSFLKSSEDMAELLRATEPKFGPLVGLGLGDAVRYTEWLRASAAIESHKTGLSVDEVIIARLSRPTTDERKVMSFLLSPQAGPMLAAAPPDSQVQKLVTVAQVYSAQSPGNQIMADMVQEIRARMKHPPAATPPVVAVPHPGPSIGSSPAPQGMPIFVPR